MSEDVQQLNLFEFAAEPSQPAGLVLNGMYYERSTDMFVSFVLGRRHYQEPAKGCPHMKEWQERIKREKAI